MFHKVWQRCRPLFHNRNLSTLIVLNVLLGLAYSFIVPFFSMFGTIEVGMSPVAFGTFMTITSISGVIIGTTLAHYSDTRFSRRNLLLVGAACGAIGYIGYAYVRSIVPLTLIGSLVLGVSGICFSQLFAHIRETLGKVGISPAENAFYMNAYRMFFALAWTVGPALASWVMVGFSYRGLFLCASACFVLFLIGVWLFIPPGMSHKSPEKAAKSESFFRLLARRDILAHFSAFVLISMAGTVCMMNLPLLVLHQLGGNEHHVGIIYSVAPVFELPFMLYFGLLATRGNPARIIRAGFIISLCYYGGLSLVQVPWHVYPLQILSAAATAIVSGVAITYFQNYLPDHPGTATNLYSNAQRIGSTVGYLIFGTLVWRFGHRAVFVACTLFAVLSLLLMQVRGRHEEAAQQSGTVF